MKCLLVFAGIASLAFVGSPPVAAQNQHLSGYFTNFSSTENPISERGRWVNGGTAGLDWGNVQTTRKEKAWGTAAKGDSLGSIALMAGTWESDLAVRAVIRAETSSFTGKVALLLRGSISAHSARFYEFTCSAGSTEIVRWNGPPNDHTQLSYNGSAHCKGGDIFGASAVGNTLTSYINGVQVNQVTDNEYPSGAPGIGFFAEKTSAGANYGFSSFAVNLGPGNFSLGPAPAPPSIVSVKTN